MNLDAWSCNAWSTALRLPLAVSGSTPAPSPGKNRSPQPSWESRSDAVGTSRPSIRRVRGAGHNRSRPLNRIRAGAYSADAEIAVLKYIRIDTDGLRIRWPPVLRQISQQRQQVRHGRPDISTGMRSLSPWPNRSLSLMKSGLTP